MVWCHLFRKPTRRLYCLHTGESSCERFVSTLPRPQRISSGVFFKEKQRPQERKRKGYCDCPKAVYSVLLQERTRVGEVLLQVYK